MAMLLPRLLGFLIIIIEATISEEDGERTKGWGGGKP